MKELEALFYLVPVCSVIALAFAAWQARRILKFSEGSERMVKLAKIIRVGARAYLQRQYRGVGIFFAVVTVILAIMAFAGYLPPFTPFAFLSGGFFSGLAGFVGMSIATSSNARTAQAASGSLNSGLKVAFASGSVMGFTVVGLGLLDLSIWFFILKAVPLPFVAQLKNMVYEGMNAVALEQMQIEFITSTMLTFGMGASSMALFARVGGGIYTKAADVGADLVGKNEQGIPEDDPRNPAVIADNVGDNVGDVAGMGADLYESYVGSVIATAALAVSAGFGFYGVALPLLMAAVGIVVSLICTFLVSCKEDASQKTLLAALRRGTWAAAALSALAGLPLTYLLIVKPGLGGYGYYVAILSGLAAGVLIGYFTEYYTSDTYKPTQKLAETSLTGPATIIIGGIALGMQSTVIPVVVVGVSVMVSFMAAGGAGAIGSAFGSQAANQGLFGIGLSAVGMLSTLGITLATDAYGPVADNAGGIAEMSGLGEEVRKRTDALDSLGNTTAATGKGFAIGSAALTALALISAFIDEIHIKDPGFVFDLTITNPVVLVGLFIGAMLPYLFSSFTMNAVGRAAQSVVLEVRRQFKEIAGIMEGKAEPDYSRCIDICTKSAQREMVLPALCAIIVPILTGFFLGINGVVGLLAGSTVSGFILAVMMSNCGGAWDNAKKYIEAGNHGGKHSDPHMAAVVGDTVGDPFKDTSGPAINILIKLVSMVCIVFSGVMMAVALIK
ncbi:MAG: sodium-translocating pyrophosphatase [Lachnospiraceae bacterium]|jgi:K(+)-stimulated pyrophosphate-energized sodium pump|nr:sodium-translocating pyrophosphatase [Lachnospiraceae bacterium]